MYIVDIKLSKSPVGLQISMIAYCGQIATEDLKILHPGVTGLGLCFIIKVWLVTLIGLTNSLSFQLLRDDKKRARIHDQGSKSTADLCFAWQGIQPTVLQLFLRFSRDLQCTNAPELITLHKTQHKFT